MNSTIHPLQKNIINNETNKTNETNETNETNKPKKVKKQRPYFIGNPGGYRNVHVPITNYHTTPIAKRINKDMTSLNIQDQPTKTNLESLIKPVLIKDSDIDESYLKNEILKNEKTSNIFNYSYNNINPSLAEKIKEYENEEEIKNKLKNNNNIQDINLFGNNIIGNGLGDFMYETYVIHSYYNNDEEAEAENNKEQINIPLKILQLTKPIIENVYQEKYNDNMNATGLGDFIRGSYFLMEFCDNNNIPYNINILNHPVSQFFEMYKNKQPLIYNNINKFELTNHNPHISDNNIITNIYDSAINDNFIEYLSKQRVHSKKLYVYTIAYPSAQISQKHKEYMKQILNPNMRLKSLIDNMLLDLGLVKHQFTIIHIRYGDDFLIQKKLEINKSHLEMIQNTMNKFDPTQKYLLISDNAIIKNLLHLKYPFIKIHLNQISHTGEGLHLETNKLQNTMIDFNLFSYATNVIAFSIYNHGTGFSRWATETYNVPYVCRFLS